MRPADLPPSDWRERLVQGDLRSAGHAGEVACELGKSPARAGELVALLFDMDRGVRMRAADALEKASRGHPELLAGFAGRLLQRAEEAVDPELKWHLAQMLARVQLTSRQQLRARSLLDGWMDDRSVIVRVEALSALVAFAMQDRVSRRDIERRLRTILESGRAAEKARARRIMVELGGPIDARPLRLRRSAAHAKRHS